LQTKAKNEPAARFYSLWDKVCRADILAEAYRRCRRKRGVPGIDGESFEDIETAGREAWLGRLQQELKGKSYQPGPLLRVWIAKASGGERPLGIPSIRDRVVQTAVLLVIGPLFEPDLFPWQYGFRTGLDAKMAVRRIHFGISDRGKREVVDADLSDYFSTIPHGELMRCVSRRIADGTVLSLIRAWLNTPVVERDPKGARRTTTAKDQHRGTPQGAPISPLLANLYFRRFMLAWYRHGYAQAHQGEVVNYADDRVPRRHAGGRKPSVQPCCTRDEGRPLAAAVQAEAANRPLRLRLRGVVVSELGKGRARPGQVRTVESNVSEPLMTCRKRRNGVETGGSRYPGISLGATCLLPRRRPA